MRMTARLRSLLRYALSCFLAFSVLLSVFAVNSSAAQTFTYRLSDFSFYEGDRPSTFGSSSYLGKSVTKVAFNSSSSIRGVAYVKLTSEFKIGNSYTLTFSASRASGVGLSGLTLYLASSLPFNDTDGFMISDITSDDLLSTGYKDYSVQLTLPDSFNGKQVYLCALIFADEKPSTLYVSDFVFTNNNNTDEKIDGILEWLSATYHGIVGGEDSRGVQHDGLVQGIKNGLSGLGDRISNFFENLGEKFGVDIGSLGDRIRDFFSNFWENVSAGFDAIKDKIGDIGEGIKAKFQEISDNFANFFDTFKPRVYEEFLWEPGNVSSFSGSLIPNSKGDENAVTSELFSVPSESSYVLDYNPANSSSQAIAIKYIEIFKYSSNGKFTGYTTKLTTASTFNFERGFSYRIVVSTKSSNAANVNNMGSYNLSKFCNSFVKVYCDEGWINALIHSLMNGLKKLFIPAPGFFDDKLDDFLDAYEEHFGIFAQGTIYFTKAIQKVQSVLNDRYSFVFPELSITIQGQKYIFSEQKNVDIQQWLKSGTWSANLYEMYRVFASAFLIYLVLLYARKVEAVILNNTPELAEQFDF